MVFSLLTSSNREVSRRRHFYKTDILSNRSSFKTDLPSKQGDIGFIPAMGANSFKFSGSLWLEVRPY
jgi:hypothetical protein